MSVATSTAIALGTTLAATGAGIAGSTIASNKQASSADYAAALNKQTADNSLAFNEQQYADTKANQAPFVQAGQGAINNLSAETQPGGSLNQPWTTQFNAPAPFSFSAVNLQNDPAYNFDLQQGQQAIQRSAAAQGGLVSGGALKDLNDYSQNFAANQFQQSYQNADNTYQQNYQNALGQYQQAYSIFQNNQNNSFNKQAAVAGIGQTGTNALANEGANASATGAAIAQNGTAAQTNYLTQGAVASSAGAVGATNAGINGINGIANAFAMNSGSSYGGNGSNNPVQSPGYWDTTNAG